MIHKYTFDSLVYLLENIGLATEEQLVRFFSAEAEPRKIREMLYKLVDDNICSVDSETGIIRYMGCPDMVKEQEDKRIEAFWVVAYFGSTHIQEVTLTRVPATFMFIDQNENSDPNSWDITVIENENDARLAQRMRLEMLPRDVPDIVNHIALLRHPVETVPPFLKKCGFDIVCYLEPNFRPTYFYIE